MAIGDKIKKIRTKRGMTQKELGIAVGFGEMTADVRMAQYESGTRVPKEAVVIKIAEILKVNPDYLMAPALTSTEEIIHTMIFLDEYNQVHFDETEYTTPEGESLKRIGFSLPYLNRCFEEWAEQKKALQNGEMTQEEYYEWKVNWGIKEN